MGSQQKDNWGKRCTIDRNDKKIMKTTSMYCQKDKVSIDNQCWLVNQLDLDWNPLTLSSSAFEKGRKVRGEVD